LGFFYQKQIEIYTTSQRKMDTWLIGFIAATSLISLALLFLFIIRTSVLVAKRILSISENRPTKLRSGLRDRKAYTLKEIENYSEGFSNKIGEGITNDVFKGILPDGMEVAIKVPKSDVAHSSDVEARSRFQLELLSRIRHQHLVNLIGYCEDGCCRMLIFQYAPNGTLFEHLHGYEHLTWKQRMRIVIGIAYGLAYLHHSCDPPVIHGDFRSCNILLTEDYAAKINGIGKVPVLASSELALVRRTGASVDPETVHKGVYSRAGDVYSFGILLLEIASGRLPFSEQTGLLVEWAGKFLQSKEQMVGLIDPTLNKVDHAELCSVCEVARLCIQRDSSSRPVMRDVVEMLTKDLKIATETAAPANSPVTLRGLLEIL
jgi:serine/threonine protein kinase